MSGVIVVATSTWNSVDIIEQFLVHYWNLGVDKVYVAEYHSTDGTREVLGATRWNGFVESFDIDSLAGLDSSNRLLNTARRAYKNGWCVFCDPDEFLVTPSMRIDDPAFSEGWDKFDGISIPRFNMTTLVSEASSVDAVPLNSWVLRISKAHQRVPSEYTDGTLTPSWIFTALPGKVVARLDSGVVVGPGDHEMIGSNNAISLGGGPSCFLHYPVRSYEKFEEKIRLAKLDLAANPDLPSWNSWHWRRWSTLLDQGVLPEEYRAQFIADRDLSAMLDAGTIVRDERIAQLEWVAGSSAAGVPR